MNYKILTIPTLLLSILLAGCTQPVLTMDNSSVKEDITCEIMVGNLSNSADYKLSPMDFSAQIGMYVEGLDQKDLPKVPGKDSQTCAKARAIQCLLESYAGIDLVQITSSCHGVSYREKEAQTWGNIFINNEGEG